MKKIKWIIPMIGIAMIISGIVIIFISKDKKISLGQEFTEDYVFDPSLVDYTKDTLPEEYKNYDFDGDGLKNSKEIELGTEMYMVDTDKDGLSDSEEANKTKTDPIKWSSRDDDMSDLEYTIINNASFKKGYSNLDISGYRVYLENASDQLFIISKAKTIAFDELETVSEAYQIKNFTGKMALDCSSYIDEVVNSISIYKIVNKKAEKIDSVVEENGFLSFEVSDGDIFCAVYSK
ncbi:MAG: hypothetical protein IJO43_03750 [Bacilli bacterium]|nr:hypothetical protein [Bacilli bacterium]